ncbi:MAG: hypothetical protein H7222_10335 [Methylotenera sp.]|nr:hypothetical protein [Oligoflexia bacterium]
MTTTRQVGYILVDTFSPAGDSAAVQKEFKATLKSMQMFGVENLIIDTLNNGRGSLILGMEMAQALSSDKIVLLVNEMCASMCDILADNVVGHENDQAPSSHLALLQIESLMIRKDGTYLENNGVTPDVAITVDESSSNKYEAVRKLALKVVFGAQAVKECRRGFRLCAPAGGHLACKPTDHQSLNAAPHALEFVHSRSCSGGFFSSNFRRP